MKNNKFTEEMPVFRAGEGVAFDLLDLKVSLLYHGIHVDEAVYREFEATARFTQRPSDYMILGGQVACLISRTNQQTPFRLILQDGRPVITCNDVFLTEAGFHEKSSFHDQTTTGGVPFRKLGSILGWDELIMACLWKCEIAQSGQACGFCHTGNYAYPEHSLSEMMDVIRYAFEISPQTKILKLTSGSTFHPEHEIDWYVSILKAIDATVGITKVPTFIYLTPPSDLKQIDRLFEAGVSWVSCNMDIWDERLFEKICPGKARITTRRRYIDALYYIAGKYGPNRACCPFVAGIEPVETLIEGANELAAHGVVPWISSLMPFASDKKTIAEFQPFSLGYYRTVRKEIAKLYQKHELVVPGTFGCSICMGRDIWLRRSALAAE